MERIDIFSVIHNVKERLEKGKTLDLFRRVIPIHYNRAIKRDMISIIVNRVYSAVSHYQYYSLEELIQYIVWLYINPDFADEKKTDLWKRLKGIEPEDVKKSLKYFSQESSKENLEHLKNLNKRLEESGKEKLDERMFNVNPKSGHSVAFLLFKGGHLTPRIFLTPYGRKALTECEEDDILLDEYRMFIRAMKLIKTLV